MASRRAQPPTLTHYYSLSHVFFFECAAGTPPPKRKNFAATSGVCLIRSGAGAAGFSKETTFAKKKERKKENNRKQGHANAPTPENPVSNRAQNPKVRPQRRHCCRRRRRHRSHGFCVIVTPLRKPACSSIFCHPSLAWGEQRVD